MSRRFDEPEDQLGPVKPRDTSGILTIPTGDRRHMSHIREGVVRYQEVFAHDRIKRLPVDSDALVVDKAKKAKAKAKTGLDTKAARSKKQATK